MIEIGRKLENRFMRHIDETIILISSPACAVSGRHNRPTTINEFPTGFQLHPAQTKSGGGQWD